jgi:hypothetical protein
MEVFSSIVTVTSKEQLHDLASALQREMSTEFTFDSKKIGKYRDIAARLAGYAGYKAFLASGDLVEERQAENNESREFRIYQHTRNPSLRQLKEHLKELLDQGYGDELAIGCIATDPNIMHSIVCSALVIEENTPYLRFEQVRSMFSYDDFVFKDHLLAMNVSDLVEELNQLPSDKLSMPTMVCVKINSRFEDGGEVDYLSPERIQEITGVLTRLVGITEAMELAQEGSPVDLYCESKALKEFNDVRGR